LKLKPLIDIIDREIRLQKDPKKIAFLTAAKSSIESAEEIEDKRPEMIKDEEKKSNTSDVSKRLKATVQKAIKST